MSGLIHLVNKAYYQLAVPNKSNKARTLTPGIICAQLNCLQGCLALSYIISVILFVKFSMSKHRSALEVQTNYPNRI